MLHASMACGAVKRVVIAVEPMQTRSAYSLIVISRCSVADGGVKREAAMYVLVSWWSSATYKRGRTTYAIHRNKSRYSGFFDKSWAYGWSFHEYHSYARIAFSTLFAGLNGNCEY